MANITRYIAFSLLMFVGPNVTEKVGIDYKIVMILIALLSILITIYTKINIKAKREELFLLLFISIYCMFKMAFDTSDGTRMLSLILLLTPIVFLAYPSNYNMSYSNIRLWHGLQKVVLVFYIIECGIAIFEQYTGIYIFSYAGNEGFYNDNFQDRRALGIHGHPLQNALIISTFMCFILISPIKIKYKYILWGLGYWAILSFNSRSSILGNGLLFALYNLGQLSSGKVNVLYKLGVIVFLIAGVTVVSYLISQGMFGGRLQNGLIDDSSQVRIDVWSIFDHYDIMDFAFGVSSDRLNAIIYSLGLYATENFWIDILLRFGFVFLAIVVVLYYFLIKRLMYPYSLSKRMFVLAGFFIIASTNNSLSVTSTPLIIFLFCCILFNPLLLQITLDRKYFNFKESVLDLHPVQSNVNIKI
ncbi:hypothetical protein [Siphonobacter curvatus]|uniref:O-antigen ligase domain-containing protein n=1 Tax=Siphonobacter curvatus TaxID=2094562 RepID=A0A2S7IE71_9BACT|nr:hypothetical protein [Siphonobacter curvatus]PQA52732.1 hypothetical protein C5O19_25700 [Siphonobacter curvatus]